MTKYLRQQISARKTITRKGFLATWYKPGAAVGNDPTPEFPELADAQDYPNIPIVLYPVNRTDQGTITYDPSLMSGLQSLFGIIPGDLPFTPEENDAVMLGLDQLVHVNYINIVKPDNVPIVYEIGFKQ